MMTPDALVSAVERHPRVAVAHVPTPIEALDNLGADLGVSLRVKCDDCTGIGFGGNKVRQLEFYFGAALEEGADTVLITGAVQSNLARTAAVIARRFDMECHIQLEERVAHVGDLYRDHGNVLLDRLLGANIHRSLTRRTPVKRWQGSSVSPRRIGSLGSASSSGTPAVSPRCSAMPTSSACRRDHDEVNQVGGYRT